MVIDFSTFYDVPRQFDRVMEEFMRPYPLSQRRMAYPPLNISEDEERIYVSAEIPGVSMDDLELTITDKSLVIRGERKGEQGKFFRQERPMGAFQRVVTLGIPVDREGVKATLADGILEIVLPKADEVKPKQISIDVS
jgi:HSP20 family protein